ncbi:hypothetical protein QC760_003965 [Botrytis cinerea]|uniref:Glycosyltransferase family 71 protein n=1 Tax=Botryotinia fuckeliana (strain T4) TaxID=999810 RepID=G2YZ65_BOTF4|nr:glycosyltransferase family 71 protein [Botrytis cinerea T4]
MLASSLSKKITIIIIVIFVSYLSFRDQLWSLETPVFLQEPLTSFTISTTHTTHNNPNDSTNINIPINNAINTAIVEISIADIVRRLHEAAPPKLTESAACVGKTLGIEQVTNVTERRDVTPVSDEQVEAAKLAHKSAVEVIRTSTHLVPYKSGTQGIVTVAGGRFTGALLVSLRMLRRTNSTLPVEVFMPNPEDYNEHTCEVVLPSLNARCVMIPKYEGLTISKYQYKIFAVILSSFEDVLFLDADNFPIVDPVEWFKAPVFKDNGYVLWPDFWWATTSPHYFRVLELPTPSLLSLGTTESGQVIMSKRTHSDVLLLVLYYNIFGPSFYYPLLTQCDAGEGDKETWLYAAIALEKDYYQVRQRNGVIGHHTADGFRGSSMMQHNPSDDYSTYLQEEKEKKEHPVWRKDVDAEVVFMHHNLIKLSPVEMISWIAKNKGSRMWGNKESTMKTFKGQDLEKTVWEELLWVGCQGGESLVNWTEEVCEGLMGHWGGIVAREAEEEIRKMFGVNKQAATKDKKEE